MEHQLDFTGVAAADGDLAVASLQNFSPFQGSATIVCGFLQYVNDNGVEFNYQAIADGSAECILYFGGTVSSTSGQVTMRRGDTYKVTLRPGQSHGWVCW